MIERETDIENDRRTERSDTKREKAVLRDLLTTNLENSLTPFS